MKILRGYLERPEVVKILSNASWLFSDRILRMILTLFVSAWVARYLGVEQYGQLNLALAYIGLAMPIVKLGLDQILIKQLVESPNKAGEILGTSLWMRLFATLALLPLIIIIVNQLHIDQPIITLLTLLLSIGLVFQTFEIINIWFQAQVESRYSVITRNISFFITSVLKVVAILSSGSLLLFGFIYLLDIIMSVLLLIFVYRRREKVRWTIDWSLGKKIMNESAPLIIAGLAVIVYMRIDQVMLGQMLPKSEGEAAVGIYSVAVKLSELWYFVPAALINSIFPALLESKQQSESLYRKRLQRLLNIVVLICYVFSILITMFSGIIIEILFGTAFAEATPILAILVWAGVWVNIGVVRTYILITEDVVHYSMWSTLIGAGVNVGLNLLLIPSMGAAGCAIATLVSYFISAYLTSFFFNLSVPIGKMQTISLLIPNPLLRR